MTHSSQPAFIRRSFLLAAVIILSMGRADAADSEIRDFGVTIDGKQAGTYRMTIQRYENGSISMVGQANIKVSYLVASYRYQYTGSEVWSNGRLYALESKTNDDGKEFAVSAAASGDVFKIKVNGRERTTRSDVWLTTYWHKPDTRFLNQSIPLVDADTGKDIAATIQFVGNEEVTCAGQRQACTHYRLRGGVTVDLWYDGQDRLLKQESVDDGHRVVQELTNIH